jgi:2-methylcitrate dehydratase PrpD
MTTTVQPTTLAETTRGLASFVANLSFDQLPDEVVRMTEELFLDWMGSALAGKGARPVAAFEEIARQFGPVGGPAEILTSRGRSSALFAAMINGAASHVVEQDDVHNSSVFHPATVVFPPALAVAQERVSTGREFITACVAGYEVGIRVGEFLGRSHYQVFHTTGTAGTLASAAAVAKLLNLNEEQTLHALGTAGTQAAGLWEFLRDAADSKQVHTAKASSDGLLAAYLAESGTTGATRILEGAQGMAAGMSSDADPTRLTDGLGERWTILETSYKFHASCRHTHPSADALLKLMQENDLKADDLKHVRAHATQGGIDVLGPVTDPQTIHQSKFSMGFVLALIAVHGRAGVTDFSEAALRDPQIRAVHDKVEMVLDPEINAAYPKQWIGYVEAETVDGRHLSARVEVPKGDPGNSLSREELEDKARRLAEFSGAASREEFDRVIERVWNLHYELDVQDFFPPSPEAPRTACCQG